MIAEHWKIDPLLIKKENLLNIRGYKENKGIVSVSIKNKELVPDWCHDKVKIFLEGYSPCKGDSDCVINKNEEEITFLSINHDSILINNFDKIIDYIIHENYFEQKQPFFSKLPFSYTHIPPRLRVPLFNILLSFKKDPKFPHFPIEKSVELMRYIYIKALSIKSKKDIPYISFWPKGKFAFSITHDCDTKSSFDNIEKIREIEKKYEMKSSWYILSNRYKIDLKKIKKLKKEGCEIGLHGYNHDTKLPFLKTEEIKHRISKASNLINSFKIKGFRSPCLLKNKRFLDIISNYFDYDSSTSDTDIRSVTAMRSGTCTVFPFFINKMVEIPITLAQDYRLIRLGKTKSQIFNIWREKIDFIEKINGSAVMLIHPDTHIFGSEKYLSVYDRILKYASKKNNVWNSLPCEIAKWWRERNNSKIKNNKIIGSKNAMINLLEQI